MAAFNPEDPRHQREQQRAAAKRSMGPTRGVSRSQIGEISGRHAGYQLGRQEQFRGLALSSELAKQRHAQALTRAGQWDKSFGLSERGQGFRESEFGEDMDRRKSALNQTMLMGGLGLGMSVLEGRRQEKILQSNIAAQNYRTGLLEDYIMSVRAPYGYRATEEEQ